MLRTSPSHDFIYALLLAPLVLYVVPVFIVANNSADFQHLSAGLTLAILLMATMVVGVAAGLVATALRRVPSRPLFALARFGFFFLLCTGLFLPLTVPAGEIEAGSIPTAYLNLMLAGAVAAVLTAVSYTKISSGVLAGAIAILAFNGGMSTWVALRNIAPKATDALFVASSQRNVFVLSFDGLPRDAALDLVRTTKSYTEAFKDFTFFKEAVGGGVATEASIMSEISGIENLKGRFQGEADFKTMDGSTDLITNQLAAAGYATSVHGAYHANFAEKARSHGYGTLDNTVTLRHRLEQVAELIEYAVARMASSRAVFGRGYVDFLAATLGIHDDPQSLTARTRSHAGEKWDINALRNIIELDRYIAELNVATDKPVAHFMHFVHTHFPVDFDASCQYRSDDKAWYTSNQNEQGLRAQTACAFSQYQRFLVKLKALGIYDKSLIVFKSDHGEPPQYYDVESVQSFTVRNHTHWGYGRYAPLLAFKGFAAIGAEPAFDERPVAISDLAKSICTTVLGVAHNCNSYGGFNIFDPAQSVPTSARYFVYVVKSAGSNWRFDGHEAIELQRGTQFFDALNKALVSKQLRAPPLCNHEFDLKAGRPFNNGQTDEKSWFHWRDQGQIFLQFKAPECGVSMGRIALKLGGAHPGEAAKPAGMTINGQQVDNLASVSDNPTNGSIVDLPLPQPLSAGTDVVISIGSASHAKLVFNSMTIRSAGAK